MGAAGKKRKPGQHLPKVQGNPGKLWTEDDAVPYAHGERFLRSVGRVGPNAQARYFRDHPTASIVARLVGVVLVATFVLLAIAGVVFS